MGFCHNVGLGRFYLEACERWRQKHYNKPHKGTYHSWLFRFKYMEHKNFTTVKGEIKPRNVHFVQVFVILLLKSDGKEWLDQTTSCYWYSAVILSLIICFIVYHKYVFR